MKLPSAEGQWGASCTPASCSPYCALALLDEVLQARNSGGLSLDEVDTLLDLRWVLSKRQDAERAVILFCALRRCLEERFYLSFYRLRRWLENQIEARVRLSRGDQERVISVRMERFCPEAVRYQCLEMVREAGEPLQAPKVTFGFRNTSPLQLLPKVHLPCEGATTDKPVAPS